jgi:hypothetical protein
LLQITERSMTDDDCRAHRQAQSGSPNEIQFDELMAVADHITASELN